MALKAAFPGSTREITAEEYRRTVWASLSEAVFQSQVIGLAKSLGWGPIYHTRYSLGSKAGYPDLHLLRGRRSVFMELKTMKGVVTSAQREWHDALNAAGCEAYIFRPSDQDEIERVLQGESREVRGVSYDNPLHGISYEAPPVTFGAATDSFSEFQRTNARRCRDGFGHDVAWDDPTWPIQNWALAIAGEAGELCNLVKKCLRGDFTVPEKNTELLKELADIITYCDLAITSLGGETGPTVWAKFDEVSQRIGWRQ